MRPSPTKVINTEESVGFASEFELALARPAAPPPPPPPGVRDQPWHARSTPGSLALSFCTTAHPHHTKFTNIFGACISEAIMSSNPRSAALERLDASHELSAPGTRTLGGHMTTAPPTSIPSAMEEHRTTHLRNFNPVRAEFTLNITWRV